ncbi:MAG: WD40 repeat domain-containing protein [Myxococcales bacterium]|nr:WD40 repeat domain-containing protein [Myxococcales bacterium]
MSSVEPRASQFERPARWKFDAGDYVAAMSVDPRDELVAIATSAGAVHVVRLADGARLWTRELFSLGAHGVDWSPDGATLLACGQDRFAAVLSRDSGDHVFKLDGGGPWVEHAKHAPHGRTIAIAAGKIVRFFHRDGAPLLETPRQASTITAIEWRPDGNELATACYGGVHFWTPSRGISARQFLWKGSLLSLAWSPDTKVIAAASQDCSVHFWRTVNGRDSQMTGYPFKPLALAWDAKSSMLATSGDKTALVWDFAGKGPEGTAPIELEAHRALITKVAFHKSRSILATVSEDASLLLWEPRRTQRPVAFGFVDGVASALAWTRSTGVLVGDDSGAVACFDAQ